MKSVSRWFHYTEVVSLSVSQYVSQPACLAVVNQSVMLICHFSYKQFYRLTFLDFHPHLLFRTENKGLHGSDHTMTATSGPKTVRRPRRLAVQNCSEWNTSKKTLLVCSSDTNQQNMA
jgi:hypothetical protein